MPINETRTLLAAVRGIYHAKSGKNGRIKNNTYGRGKNNMVSKPTINLGELMRKINCADKKEGFLRQKKKDKQRRLSFLLKN
jgi:hypothetical protein